MPVSAHDVAAELRARQPGMPVKKLHKLLYYCQGHHLAVHGEPLFRERFDEWVARESLPAELRRVVEAWVITRYANPYEGMFQEPGFPNLWSGKVPGSEDGCGNAVACSYLIEESTHTVKCNDFAILGEPII